MNAVAATAPLERHVAITQRVENVLARCARRHVEAAPASARPVLRTVEQFVLRRGKRLRPLFCYWAWRGAGGTGPDEDIIVVGAAIEMFHVAALIHDDLIDGSGLRRGRPSLHRMLAQLHRDNGWHGDSDQFGRHAALLAGDGCLMWSEELFYSRAVGLPEPRLTAAYQMMRAEAVHGELLDLLGALRDGSLEFALETARLKTAGYTVRYPVVIGGLVGGASESLLAAYDAFGRLTGEAFQLRDDLAGIFGDPSITGKSVIDDVRRGTLTALIAAAREMADGPVRTRLDSIYGNDGIDENDLAQLRDLVESIGARSVIEETIRLAHASALRELDQAELAPDARDELGLLAYAALNWENSGVEPSHN